MPIMKAYDLAYGRLRSPDLDKQEEFLTDFGMVRADRTKNALYMRGTDAPHHIHVTELGEPRYVGIAVHAASMEDLDRVSRVDGASKIEDIDEPGGGKRVRLTDPDGYQVEVVYGMEMLDPIPVKRPAVNSGNEKYRRKGELFRVDPGPSHIKRFGHFVIMTTNFEKTSGVVSRDPRIPVLGRVLCRREEQCRRVVQSARPRRRLCRPSRLLLHPRRQERAEPSVL